MVSLRRSAPLLSQPKVALGTWHVIRTPPVQISLPSKPAKTVSGRLSISGRHLFLFSNSSSVGTPTCRRGRKWCGNRRLSIASCTNLLVCFDRSCWALRTSSLTLIPPVSSGSLLIDILTSLRKPLLGSALNIAHFGHRSGESCRQQHTADVTRNPLLARETHCIGLDTTPVEISYCRINPTQRLGATLVWWRQFVEH